MNDYYTQIKEHAHSVPEQEVCGFLFFDRRGSLQAERVANIAEDPARNFRISEDEYLQAIHTGDLAAYYHSHWDCCETFSPEDIRRADIACLPLFVYSTYTKQFNLYRPKNSVPSYLGRQFVLGFQDCASLVTDYVKLVQNVDLPYFERPKKMLQDGFRGLWEYLKENGYSRLYPSDQLQKNDILAFSVNSTNACSANHVGIYLGDGTFIHQLAGLKSTISPLRDNWMGQLVFAARIQR